MAAGQVSFCFVDLSCSRTALRRRLTDWYTWLVRLVWANCFCFDTFILSPWSPFREMVMHIVRGRRRISYILFLFC